MSHLVALSSVVLLIGLGSPAPAQEDAARAARGRAESLLEQGDKEGAAAELRAAWLFSQQIPRSAARERRELQKELAAELGKVDPRGRKLAETRSEAAEKLLVQARAYRKVGWTGTALEVLVLAEQLDGAQVREELTGLRRELGLAVDVIAAQQEMIEWFDDGIAFYHDLGWKVRADGVEAPAIQGRGGEETCMFATQRKLAGNQRIGVQIRVGAGGKAAFCWDLRGSATTYALAEIERGNQGLADLRVMFLHESGEYQVLSQAFAEISPDAEPDWFDLTLEIRGDEIAARLAGMEGFSVSKLPRPMEGRLALFVSGDSKAMIAAMYRSLVIEEL